MVGRDLSLSRNVTFHLQTNHQTRVPLPPRTNMCTERESDLSPPYLLVHGTPGKD